MDSRPFFSIIIPTFNSAKTLQSCLQSIIVQTHADFEIIVQDGGSTDDTLAVANGFKDTRIRVISEADEGLYDAMNKAVEQVAGQWILFLGSDDRLFEPKTLETLHITLTAITADFVYGNVMVKGDSDWMKDGEIYMGETSLATLFEKNLSHQCILYHENIFRDGNRFNLNYPICADFDLNLRCFASYAVAYTPLVVSVFATGGISSNEVDERFETEKWGNIVNYYRFKLLDKALIKYKGIIKKTGKQLIKDNRLDLGGIAILAYLYYKVRRIFS